MPTINQLVRKGRKPAVIKKSKAAFTTALPAAAWCVFAGENPNAEKAELGFAEGCSCTPNEW